MLIVFYIFAALLIASSLLSLRGGIEYLRFFRRETGIVPDNKNARSTTLIVPCKGLDQRLEDNLAAMCRMDHPRYEVLFVVEGRSDPAAEVIGRITAANGNAKLIFAPKAEGSSQKIANLIEAIRNASPRSEIFAFADSDARPDSGWLRHLTAPLEDANVGAATGYRWFISRRRNFGSELRSVWNASVASALGPKTESNFCWGGSMAMTREMFERLEIEKHWAGALSDDFAVTRAVHNAGLEIRFVPRALTPTVEDYTFAEMLEFTTRQMKITRVYRPRLWAVTLVGSAHFCSVMLAALVILFSAAMFSFAFWSAAVTLFAVILLSTAKSALRLRAISIVLSAYQNEMQRQKLSHYTLWILTPAVYFYNCVCALFSRKLKWRGNIYEMVSPTETRKLN